MTKATPANQGQLSSNDPGGYRSCVAYSFAYACDDATNGAFSPTGRQIRNWTGDTSGGLELGQCEAAVETRSNAVEFTTTVLDRPTFYAKLAAGFGMVLLGSYSEIRTTKYSGQDSFSGNHGIYVPPNKHVMDPLCDGRHAGVYRYHDELYPDWLIDLFAAKLRLSNGHQGGANRFEVSFVKVKKEASLPNYRVRLDPGTIGKYRVSGASVVGNPRKYTLHSPGETVNCTRPKSYRRRGHPMAHLVQPASGRLQGAYISVNNSNVHVEER